MLEELETALDRLADKRCTASPVDLAVVVNTLMGWRVSRVTLPNKRATGNHLYGLWDAETLVYVGKTSGLHTRISTHRSGDGRCRPEYNFDSWSAIEVKPDGLGTLERRVLMATSPRYNGRHVKPVNLGFAMPDDLHELTGVDVAVIWQIVDELAVPLEPRKGKGRSERYAVRPILEELRRRNFFSH
jgi:hypothetical protein